MEDKKQVIDKIKKILALAENNPNENEAVAAAMKAQALMAKFHIEEKELGEEVTENNIDSLECVVNGKSQKWRIQLASVLAKNFRCKLFLTSGNVTFYGYDEDVKICSEVFYSLYKIGVKLSDKKKREMRKEYGTATGVRNTFCLGFVRGIQSELEKQCTALMIVVPKEVTDGFDEMVNNGNWKTKNSGLRISSDSRIYNEGFQSGKEAMRSKAIEG